MKFKRPMNIPMIAIVMGLITALFALPITASAQSPVVEWTRWDAQITAQGNNQMTVVETQEVAVTGGTVSKSTRYWTSPVNVQQVYVMMGNDPNPRQLTPNSSGQPGTYMVTNNSGNPTLQYFLYTPQNQGSSFIVQIAYTAQSPTSGMVDWKVIPADHPFPVRSSTVTLHFPSGQAPDPSLVRTSANANVRASGNDIVIQSTGTIPAQQAFSLQVPFGAGVGAAGGNTGGSNNAPISPNTDPSGSENIPTINLPGGGTLLLLLCGLGLLLMFGGGSLLRSLIGGLLSGGFTQNPGGGVNRGPFGNYPTPRDPGNSQGDGSLNRGFRQSSNQDRNVGSVGSDKDSGGGVSFG